MRASESSNYETAFDELGLALLLFIVESKKSSVATPVYRPVNPGMTEAAHYEGLRYKLQQVLKIIEDK